MKEQPKIESDPKTIETVEDRVLRLQQMLQKQQDEIDRLRRAKEDQKEGYSTLHRGLL